MKKLKRVIPETQYWAKGRVSYWFLADDGVAVWRFDEGKRVDRNRKKSGNYFPNEQDCLVHFGLAEERSRNDRKLKSYQKKYAYKQD